MLDHHQQTAEMLINSALIGVLLIVRNNFYFNNFSQISENICLIFFVNCIFEKKGCTAERVFRVDSGQEHLHYITDISTDCLYILDPVSGLDVDPVR